MPVLQSQECCGGFLESRRREALTVDLNEPSECMIRKLRHAVYQ